MAKVDGDAGTALLPPPPPFPFPFEAPRTVLQLLGRDRPVPPIGSVEASGRREAGAQQQQQQPAKKQPRGAGTAGAERASSGGGGGTGGSRGQEQDEDEDDDEEEGVAGRGTEQDDGGDYDVAMREAAETENGGGGGGRRATGAEEGPEPEAEEEDAVRLAERMARALAAANVGSALLAEEMTGGRAPKRPRSHNSISNSNSNGGDGAPAAPAAPGRPPCLVLNGSTGLQVVSTGDAAAAARHALPAPPGFTSVRQYPSYRHPGRTTRYVCTVSWVCGGAKATEPAAAAAAASAPLHPQISFRVAAEDDPGGAVVAPSPSEAWQAVALRAHASQRAHDAAKAAGRGAGAGAGARPRSGGGGPAPAARPVLVASGPDLFGLTHPVVREALARAGVGRGPLVEEGPSVG